MTEGITSLTTLRSMRRNRLIAAGIAAAVGSGCGLGVVELLAAPRRAPLLMAVGPRTASGSDSALVRGPAANRLMQDDVMPAMGFAAAPIPAPPVAAPALEARREPAEADPIANDPGILWFNNRPIRPARTLRMLVTAYSPDERSCGLSADGITASGYSVWTNGMKMVAADTRLLPLGALVSVPGYDHGAVVPVLDRGSRIKGHRLDVLFPTHEQARAWGAQRLDVVVWEYADGRPHGFRQAHRPRR
jgi:3D (Asp-Asp-Asp) domain-containing protein